MNLKTILGWPAVAFIVWWVIEQPDSAAHHRAQHRDLPVHGGQRAFELRFVDLGLDAGMRLVPNTDTVPASVNRYLLPHERQVITVHQHPAVLIRPIFEVLVGLAIAGWLSNALAHGNSTALLVIWILWALLLLRLLAKVYRVGQDLLRGHVSADAALDGRRHPQGEHDAAHQGDGHELPADRDGPDLRLRRVHPRVRRAGPGAEQSSNSSPIPSSSTSRSAG